MGQRAGGAPARAKKKAEAYTVGASPQRHRKIGSSALLQIETATSGGPGLEMCQSARAFSQKPFIPTRVGRVACVRACVSFVYVGNVRSVLSSQAQQLPIVRGGGVLSGLAEPPLTSTWWCHTTPFRRSASRAPCTRWRSAGGEQGSLGKQGGVGGGGNSSTQLHLLPRWERPGRPGLRGALGAGPMWCNLLLAPGCRAACGSH